MKKILATLAGVGLVAGIGLAANSVVDTQETKSIAPVTDTVSAPAFSSEFADRAAREHDPNRSATRPVKPVVPTKPVVKPKPKPTKVVKVVKPKKKPVVRKKTPKTKYVSSRSHNAPGGIAACIRKYESGGNYRAQNPTSTASGAYQFINSTWRAITGRSDRAKDAPPSVQDWAFYKLWDHGRGAHHWVTAHKCGY
jgi:outer membrane biosynthesis protein TonB